MLVRKTDAVKAEACQYDLGCRPMTTSNFISSAVQVGMSSSDEDDSPQQAAQKHDGRGWSQEDVATLKKGIQVHGHHWTKIQVGSLLSSVTVRCMSQPGACHSQVHGRQWGGGFC